MMHFFWGSYPLGENSYKIYEYSNMEICKWAEYYFSQKVPFHQANFTSVGKVTESSNDILIGHPTWDLRNEEDIKIKGKLLRNWVKNNSLHADDTCHPNTYILMPWVPDFPVDWTIKMPYFEEQLLSAKKIFALCGDIWFNRTIEKSDDSLQSKVKDKLIHCNMGVASDNLRVKKKKFNPIGERQLLHISNFAYYKGFDITIKSLLNISALLNVASAGLDKPVGLVPVELDTGTTYTFNFLRHVNNNDPNFNNWVVENCDFYIHTGRMDAQSTTILENCARGLIPLVTPESGFASPHAIYLTLNPSENQKIIEWALNLPESELLKRSQLIQEQIIREHSWEGIFSKIWSEITIDIESRTSNN